MGDNWQDPNEDRTTMLPATSIPLESREDPARGHRYDQKKELHRRMPMQLSENELFADEAYDFLDRRTAQLMPRRPKPSSSAVVPPSGAPSAAGPRMSIVSPLPSRTPPVLSVYHVALV